MMVFTLLARLQNNSVWTVLIWKYARPCENIYKSFSSQHC